MGRSGSGAWRLAAVRLPVRDLMQTAGIVQFCKRNCLLIKGRCSTANSAVCYALEITAIDPFGTNSSFDCF